MDNKSVNVSIIMPVYNVDEYLRECLESIDKQTYRDFELLIIDDGSTDKSGDICDSFCEIHPYSRVIHTNNGGVSRARNIGLDCAKGRYIVYVDSDDVLADCYLEALVNLMEDSNDEMALIAYENESIEKLDDISAVEKSESVTVEYILNNIIRDVSIGGYLWNKIFNREIVEREHLRFLEDVAIWEDLYFVLNYLKQVSKVKKSSAKFYFYRPRSTSAVMHMTIEKKFNKIDIAEKIYNFEYLGCEQFHLDAKRSYIRTFFDYCWSAYKEKKLPSEIKEKFISTLGSLNAWQFFSGVEKLKIYMIKYCA